MSETKVQYRGAKGDLEKEKPSEEPKHVNYRGAEGDLDKEEKEKREQEVSYRGARTREKV